MKGYLSKPDRLKRPDEQALGSRLVPRFGRGSLFLDLLNPGFHPLLERRFQFCLIALGLQILDRFAGFIQSDEVARNLLRAVFLGDEINQVTLTAWIGSIRISVVNAGQRVLKSRLG